MIPDVKQYYFLHKLVSGVFMV